MRILIIIFLISACVTGCKEDISEAVSTDREIMVTSIQNPVKGNSSLPRLFGNGEDILMCWVTRADSMDILSYSTFKDPIWKPVEGVAYGSDWFVNWADFPVIAQNNQNLLITYLKKSADDTYAYDIIVRFTTPKEHYEKSPQQKIFIEKEFKLHTDNTKTEHGFVSVVPMKEDAFFLSWLDGRNTAGSSHDDHADNAGGAMTLRGAVIDSKGEIEWTAELDRRVCDCCQTSASMTPLGPVVAYRDRSEDEIRDISIIRQVGGEWLKPQTIGNDQWEIAGCPVNGPSIDSFENTLALAWFTAAKGEGEVQIVFSENAGETFGKPLRVDAGNATGRVDIAMLNASEAVVIWMEPEGEDEMIRLVKVRSDGRRGNPITISKTSPERASGFPQLEKFGEMLMMAWTEVSGETTTIKTATLSLDKL